MALLAKNQKDKAVIKRSKPLDADGLMDMLGKLNLAGDARASGLARDDNAPSGGAAHASENAASNDEDSDEPDEQPRQSALQGLFSGIMPASGVLLAI